MTKIKTIKVMEKRQPSFLDVFSLYTVLNSDKSSEGWSFLIKEESVVIDFVNLWNENLENGEVLINKISEFNIEVKDSSIQYFIDEMIDKNISKTIFQAMKIENYYDKFGISHNLLVNKNFCPFSHFVLYNNDGKTALTEYDGASELYFSPYRGFNHNEDEDSEYMDTYIIKEDESFYYCQFTPIRLAYNGFSLDFGSENDHELVEIKIDKNNLKVFSEQFPDLFENIYVKNFSIDR